MDNECAVVLNGVDERQVYEDVQNKYNNNS